MNCHIWVFYKTDLSLVQNHDSIVENSESVTSLTEGYLFERQLHKSTLKTVQTSRKLKRLQSFFIPSYQRAVTIRTDYRMCSG
jgi:hypothetical protein